MPTEDGPLWSVESHDMSPSANQLVETRSRRISFDLSGVECSRWDFRDLLVLRRVLPLALAASVAVSIIAVQRVPHSLVNLLVQLFGRR